MTLETMNYQKAMARADRKIDNLAEARGMTRQEFEDWCKRETYRQEISDYEVILIRAYQINQAVLHLEAIGKGRQADELRQDFYWIERFEKSFGKVDKAIKHLTDVCAYIEKEYNKKYIYEFLLTLDDVVYDEMMSKSRGRKISKRDDD
jgi:hypothetical protein